MDLTPMPHDGDEYIEVLMTNKNAIAFNYGQVQNIGAAGLDFIPPAGVTLSNYEYMGMKSFGDIANELFFPIGIHPTTPLFVIYCGEPNGKTLRVHYFQAILLYKKK